MVSWCHHIAPVHADFLLPFSHAIRAQLITVVNAMSYYSSLSNVTLSVLEIRFAYISLEFVYSPIDSMIEMYGFSDEPRKNSEVEIAIDYIVIPGESDDCHSIAW